MIERTVKPIDAEGHGSCGGVSPTDDAGRDAFDVLDADLASIQQSIMAHVEQLIAVGKVVTSSIDGLVVEHRVVPVAPAARERADRARRQFSV